MSRCIEVYKNKKYSERKKVSGIFFLESNGV